MRTCCVDRGARVSVSLESVAIAALLADGYRILKNWDSWEPRHNARAPLWVAVRSPSPSRALYRIDMRCEQAEALRERSEELSDVLFGMAEHVDVANALERAGYALERGIRRAVPT